MAKGAGVSAEKVVKDIRQKTRRRFSTEEKIRITSFDNSSGHVLGQAHWTTLNAIVRWEGTLPGATLKVVGTE